MPKRILIADDHESVLRRVRVMIESQPGWEVCGEAVNGREAVTKAQELNPDVIILDFAMPHLDGLRAAAEIRLLLPNVPIVMFTMYGSNLIEEVQKSGITRLVDKTQSNALVAAVEELLGTERQKSAAPASQLATQLAIPALAPVVDVNPKPEINPITVRKAS